LTSFASMEKKKTVTKIAAQMSYHNERCPQSQVFKQSFILI